MKLKELNLEKIETIDYYISEYVFDCRVSIVDIDTVNSTLALLDVDGCSTELFLSIPLDTEVEVEENIIKLPNGAELHCFQCIPLSLVKREYHGN